MIQHVAFEVRRDRCDACVEFYALLGFERVTPPPSLAERAAWVQHGPTQIHLMNVEEPVVLPRGHVAVDPARAHRRRSIVRCAPPDPPGPRRSARPDMATRSTAHAEAP